MAVEADDDIWDEFIWRWRPLKDFIASPIDGSPLRLGSDALVDGGGNEFLVLDGVPALIPNLQRLVAEHYQTSAAAGPAPEAVLDPGLRPATISGYVLGRKLELSDLEPVAPAPSSRPGRIDIDDGVLTVTCASGTYRARTMVYSGWLQDGPVRDTESLVLFLYAKPPYFLHRDAFPSAEMITLYEVMPYFRWYPLDGRQPHDAGFLQPPSRPERREPAVARERRPRLAAGEPAPSYGPEFVHNVPFFRALFQRYGIDVQRYPVLDIGGGDGFLGAAMEAAGADKPISTDLRRPNLSGFVSVYPECPKLLLGLADMFSWCYAPDAFSFIAVRNNSAICFATDLNRPALAQFIANCKRSLRADGVLYLSVISGESGVADSSGMANRPIAEYLAWFETAGLHVLQLTRLGTEIAFICCKSEVSEYFEARMKAQRWRERRRAFSDYFSGSNEPAVLRNFFLAVNDLAGEIALAAHRRRATRIGLFGQGILSYFLWRSLYISHYRLHDNLRLIASVPGEQQRKLPLRTRLARLLRRERVWSERLVAAERPGFLGERPLRVLVDDGLYASPAALDKAHIAGHFDHLFFGNAAEDGPMKEAGSAAASVPGGTLPSGDWTFPLVSGDHDTVLGPSIADHYFSGRVRAVLPSGAGSAAVIAGNAAFEARLLSFPLFYRGEQPRA